MSIKNGNNLRAFTFQRVHGCANVNSTRTWVGFLRSTRTWVPRFRQKRLSEKSERRFVFKDYSALSTVSAASSTGAAA